MTQDKITTAAEATDEVQALVDSAIETLTTGFNGRIVNGHGVYADVSMCKTDLRKARNALNKAIAIMDATPWPTEADYDAAE